MAKGGKGGDGGAAQQAQQQEQQRQQTVTQGTDAINSTFDSQFTPEYYDNLAKNYTSYAQPQLDDQYGKTQRQLTFGLARDGNLDSSTRGDQFAQLQQQYNSNKQAIAGQAQDTANSAKSAVEAARQGLITQLNSSGDATGAANSAAAQATALATPTAYAPLTDMFGATTSALATQAQNERNQALGGSGGQYNTGLFG